MKRTIIKARIGECINIHTGEKQFQLQFKEAGKNNYNGFSLDTFEDMDEAKKALDAHNNEKRLYQPFVTLGCMSQYFLAKAED